MKSKIKKEKNVKKKYIKKGGVIQQVNDDNNLQSKINGIFNKGYLKFDKGIYNFEQVDYDPNNISRLTSNNNVFYDTSNTFSEEVYLADVKQLKTLENTIKNTTGNDKGIKNFLINKYKSIRNKILLPIIKYILKKLNLTFNEEKLKEDPLNFFEYLNIVCNDDNNFININTFIISLLSDRRILNLFSPTILRNIVINNLKNLIDKNLKTYTSYYKKNFNNSIYFSLNEIIDIIINNLKIKCNQDKDFIIKIIPELINFACYFKETLVISSTFDISKKDHFKIILRLLLIILKILDELDFNFLCRIKGGAVQEIINDDDRCKTPNDLLKKHCVIKKSLYKANNKTIINILEEFNINISEIDKNYFIEKSDYNFLLLKINLEINNLNQIRDKLLQYNEQENKISGIKGYTIFILLRIILDFIINDNYTIFNNKETFKIHNIDYFKDFEKLINKINLIEDNTKRPKEFIELFNYVINFIITYTIFLNNIDKEKKNILLKQDKNFQNEKMNTYLDMGTIIFNFIFNCLDYKKNISSQSRTLSIIPYEPKAPPQSSQPHAPIQASRTLSIIPYELKASSQPQPQASIQASSRAPPPQTQSRIKQQPVSISQIQQITPVQTRKQITPAPRQKVRRQEDKINETVILPKSKVCSYLDNYHEKGRTWLLRKKCKDKTKELTKVTFKGRNGKNITKDCCLGKNEKPILSKKGQEYFSNVNNN
jgi:hypothetical protein